MPDKKQFARNRADQERLALVVVDGPQYHLRAHYNPSEVQFERTISWGASPQPGASKELSYQGDAPRTMNLDLFLDCFEVEGSTLTEDLDTLARMTVAPDPSGTDEQRRPPVIEIVNGPIAGFRCVINSFAVKATAFDKRMQPVRATVSIKLTEVTGHAGGKLEKLSDTPRTNYLVWTKPELDAEVWLTDRTRSTR